MVDWKIYKGQHPWLCDPVVDKVEYNEGSSITKSPRVSGGSPIWKVNQSGPAITDHHAPCGYWFKDYDSNSQLYRICFGLEMGYTKTNMVVDEQQTLYVKDSNGDTVDCPITTWTLDGVGSLSNLVGPTTVYTAPDYSEAGADSAIITLWCGEAVKDTLVISIAHSCDCLDTIVYTSQQMTVNQQQTLEASGMQSDECYSWAITSGGGSLSALTGKSVVYTAPATNANCVNNPTIQLSCGGVVLDTLKIAVNAYAVGGVGFFFTYTPSDLCSLCVDGPCNLSGSTWYYHVIAYRFALACDGVITTSGWTEQNYGRSTCAEAESLSKYYALAALRNPYPACAAVGWDSWCDDRSAAEKNGGCCPAALL